MVHWNKLVTREDPFHLHKILGTVCVLHFVYRYYLLNTTGSMHFDQPVDMAMVSLHGVLSISSLGFHVSSVRNVTKPMIYPEFRAHSILFALRSVVCCYLHFYRFHYMWPMVVCFQTLWLASAISEHYKRQAFIHTTEGKTMRNMPFDPHMSPEDQGAIVAMHSRMQIGATLFMWVNVDTAFLPLVAIQLAAFLMTLVRKGLISSRTWHLVYSCALWINYDVLPQFTPGNLLIFRTMYNTHYRVYFPQRWNKYVAWMMHISLYSFWRESGMSVAFDRVVYGWIADATGGMWPAADVWYYGVRIACVGFYVDNYFRYHVLFESDPVTVPVSVSVPVPVPSPKEGPESIQKLNCESSTCTENYPQPKL